MTVAGEVDARTKIGTFLAQRYPWLRAPLVLDDPFSPDTTKYHCTDWTSLLPDAYKGPRYTEFIGYYAVTLPRWFDVHPTHLLIHECGHLIANVAGRGVNVMRAFLLAMGGDPRLEGDRMINEIFAEHFARAWDPEYRGQDYAELVGRAPFNAETTKAFCEELRNVVPADTKRYPEGPVGGAPAPSINVFSYPITRGFMDMSFPQYGAHTGIDLGIPAGTEIPAIRTGVVVIDDDSPEGLEGISVKMRHEVDGATSWYAHLSTNFVNSGDYILAGQAIGRCGSTGAATGPHLHLEVRDVLGHLVDPLIYFAEEADMSFTEEDRRKLTRVYDHLEAYEPLTWIERFQRWLGRALKSIYPAVDLSGPDVRTNDPFKP